MFIAYEQFNPTSRRSTVEAMRRLMEHADEFEAEWGGPVGLFYMIHTGFDIHTSRWIGRMDVCLAGVKYA